MPQREAKFEVSARPEEVWRFIRDFQSLCSCIPGVERLNVLDERTAELTVKEKVGVVPLIVNLRAQIDAEEPIAETITAGVVQADISHYGQLAADLGTYDAAKLILDTYFALSAEVLARSPVDLLVWPETVYPTTFGAPKPCPRTWLV